MKGFYLTIVFLLFIQSTYAQNHTLKGQVHDDHNAPVEFANVLLYASKDSMYLKGGLTDIDGAYQFEGVPNGSFYIEVSQLGYSSVFSAAISLDYVEDREVEVPDMTLKQGVTLDEVTVRARKPLIELEADKIVMNVDAAAVNVGNTALEVLQKSPGVTVDQDNNVALKGKQGVLILIDGKNQYVSNDQLSRMLETMPANSIEKIEIIQNPSAKYEAAGNAGIINIKLKKNENLGMNGSATIGFGQGRYPKGNGSLNLNYRTEQFNLYGSYDRRYWKGFEEVNLSRTVPTETGLTNFVQGSDFLNVSHNNNYKVGMDYYANNKLTLGLLVRGRFGSWSGTNDNHTDISGVNIQGFDQSDTHMESREDWDQIAGNFNLSYEIDESSNLNIDVDYSNFDNPTTAIYDNRFFDLDMNEVMTPFILDNTSDIGVDIFATKLDYSKSFESGWSLESGIKYSNVMTENGTQFSSLQEGNWVVDPNLTNEFSYEEQISAVYVNLSKTFGKITVQGGLRLENTDSDGFSPTLEERNQRSYTNLFPSISLSHPIGEKHSLSYSYSRRVDRPTYRNLNPFIYFLDQFTFQKGNPFLNPQFTDSYGLNYGLGRSLFISLNYSRTTDAMSQIIDQNDETQQTFQTMINLDDYKNYSLNITAPVVISELWTTRLSATGFINDYNSDLGSSTLNRDQTSLRLNANNEFSISNKLNAELSGWYQSPVTFGIYQIQPMYSVDFGITLKVLDGQGRVRLSASDLLGTLENQIQIEQGTIDLDVNSNWESRRVNVAFTYNFGNQKVKKARQRRTATSDEEARVSRNN